jgi:hypothetical protein
LGYPSDSSFPAESCFPLGKPLSSTKPWEKLRLLVRIFHEIIEAFNHWDLICHLDFDI